MENIINTINSVIWGIPVLAMILITGVYLTIYSNFAQFRQFPNALKRFIDSIKCSGKSKSDTSGYKALCTALAATVGTGNIAGVAGAIAIGGPGTIFWMWICAVLGMITKYAEVTLAMRYRKRNNNGEFVGGPMYIIQSAMPDKYRYLAYIYSFFGVVAAFGVGNATQVNAVVSGVKDIASHLNCELRDADLLLFGGVLVILITYAFRRGGEGIGNWAEKLVPFASLSYILLCVGAIIVCRKQLPAAMISIIKGAFAPKSVSFGIIGSLFLTLRVGASRGVFTNEAGMGTASIAHASSNTNHPVDQGLMGMIEVFLDTIVICTLTALVILCSGIDIPYGTDPGVTLTLAAFSWVYGGWCRIVITALVCVFAFATILGWGLYGMRCAQFLFGDSIWRVYVYLQACAVVVGIVLDTSIVWVLAEIVNGLMAIPNLCMLYMLAPEFRDLLKTYYEKERTV